MRPVPSLRHIRARSSSVILLIFCVIHEKDHSFEFSHSFSHSIREITFPSLQFLRSRGPIFSATARLAKRPLQGCPRALSSHTWLESIAINLSHEQQTTCPPLSHFTLKPSTPLRTSYHQTLPYHHTSPPIAMASAPTIDSQRVVSGLDASFLVLAPVTSDNYYISPQSSPVIAPSGQTNSTVSSLTTTLVEPVKKEARSSSSGSTGSSGPFGRRYLKLGPIHGAGEPGVTDYVDVEEA
jgi:hypothetical protein